MYNNLTTIFILFLYIINLTPGAEYTSNVIIQKQSITLINMITKCLCFKQKNIESFIPQTKIEKYDADILSSKSKIKETPSYPDDLSIFSIFFKSKKLQRGCFSNSLLNRTITKQQDSIILRRESLFNIELSPNHENYIKSNEELEKKNKEINTLKQNLEKLILENEKLNKRNEKYSQEEKLKETEIKKLQLDSLFRKYKNKPENSILWAFAKLKDNQKTEKNKELEEKYKKKLNEYNQKEELKQEEIELLQLKNQELQKSLEEYNKQIEELKNENNHLKKENNKNQEELANCMKELESQKNNIQEENNKNKEATDTLKKEIEELNKKNKELEKKIKELESQINEITRLSSSLGELIEKNNTLSLNKYIPFTKARIEFVKNNAQIKVTRNKLSEELKKINIHLNDPDASIVDQALNLYKELSFIKKAGLIGGFMGASSIILYVALKKMPLSFIFEKMPWEKVPYAGGILLGLFGAKRIQDKYNVLTTTCHKCNKPTNMNVAYCFNCLPKENI